MSWTIELTLNTNTQRFEAWLERYRLRTLPFYTSLKNDKTLLVVGAPTFKGQRQDLRLHEIRAHIGKPGATDPEALELGFSFPVIELELFEPAENRINVSLKCNHQSLVAYHIEMLGEIAKLWPETSKSVLAYLSQFAAPEENKTRTIITIPIGYKEFHTVSNKNFETLKDRIVWILETRFFTSDPKTGETVDVESKIVSSGSHGTVDYYHIYIQGQLNGTPTQNLAIFELQGKFGEDLETYIAAVYLDNEPCLEKFIDMILKKILPDPEALNSTSEPLSEATRPDGYEILADNMGGTALYKRDEQGLIRDVKPLANPGWTFEVGPKSIAIKPERIEQDQTTGNLQPSPFPSSARLNRESKMAEEKPERMGKVFLRHKAIWKEIGFFYRSGEYKTARQGIEHMRKKHAKFEISTKTFDKIIKDGLSGKFD